MDRFKNDFTRFMVLATMCHIFYKDWGPFGPFVIITLAAIYSWMEEKRRLREKADKAPKLGSGGWTIPR